MHSLMMPFLTASVASAPTHTQWCLPQWTPKYTTNNKGKEEGDEMKSRMIIEK